MTKVHLMKIEEMGCYDGARTRYTFKDVNKKNEKIVVELGHCDGNTNLLKIWKDKKYINNDLSSWISVEVYVTDNSGLCYSKYNPQHTKDHKIDFNWILEDNKQNRCRILSEIAKKGFDE